MYVRELRNVIYVLYMQITNETPACVENKNSSSDKARQQLNQLRQVNRLG